jgi:hypothetical protein
MSFRLPQSFSSASAREGALTAIQAEIEGEKAASMGIAGSRVEAALVALAKADDEARPAALKAAADAVWGLFIQRELVGQTDHKPLIAHYGIPKEVLARLGAR